MAWIWTGMVAAAVLCGSWTGQEAAVAAAAVEGAQGAIELCISLAGMMCLWTGVMEIMRRSGLAEKLSRLLRPVLLPSVLQELPSVPPQELPLVLLPVPRFRFLLLRLRHKHYH